MSKTCDKLNRTLVLAGVPAWGSAQQMSNVANESLSGEPRSTRRMKMRMRTRVWFQCMLALSLMGYSHVHAASDRTPTSGKLSYGWATASITPDKPVALDGQYETRISGKVHDQLTATALAIETRGQNGVIDQAVMVSCDLMAIRRKTQEKVRELVRKQAPDLDVKKILI